MAGILLVGLSLITYIGGEYASSWLLSVERRGVHIYVVDAETNQHLPKDTVIVTVTGLSYMGRDMALNLVIKASTTTPTYWGFTSSLSARYCVSITATGYATYVGEVSMPENSIKEYTFKLNPEPPAGEPEPEPVPPEEPEPVELEAEVYVNAIKVGVGDTVTVDTLDLSLRVAVTKGSIQQIWGYVDEEKIIFEAGEAGEYTAGYTLPGDGVYTVTVRVLDAGGEERPLASFTAVHGSVEAPEGNNVDEAVQEALGRSANLLSAALACVGVGVYTLGSVKEEKRR